MPQITPYLAEIVPMFPVLRPHFSQLGTGGPLIGRPLIGRNSL